jgi:hypothetical protein
MEPAFETERCVKSLWDAVRSLGPLEDFSDENWCEEITSPDIYFLIVLTWGAWNESRQAQVQQGVLEGFQGMGKPLHRLGAEDVKLLASCYPYPWQRAFLHSMVGYLKRNQTSLAVLTGRFLNGGPRSALAEMELAMGTRATKIAACFLRDCVRLDVFPIDSRVGKVLEKYGLPGDSWAIAEACERLQLPTRVFARAVYRRSSDLVNGSTSTTELGVGSA